MRAFPFPNQNSCCRHTGSMVPFYLEGDGTWLPPPARPSQVQTPCRPHGRSPSRPADKKLSSPRSPPRFPGGGFFFGRKRPGRARSNPNQSSCCGHAAFMVHTYGIGVGDPIGPQPGLSTPSSLVVRSRPTSKRIRHLSSLLDRAPAFPSGGHFFFKRVEHRGDVGGECLRRPKGFALWKPAAPSSLGTLFSTEYPTLPRLNEAVWTQQSPPGGIPKGLRPFGRRRHLPLFQPRRRADAAEPERSVSY